MNKVCYVCGGSGSIDCMVTCCLCRETTEHVFCMQEVLCPVPKVWYCDGCKENYLEDENVGEIVIPSFRRKRPINFEAQCSSSKYLVLPNSIINDNDGTSLENEVSGKEVSLEFHRNGTIEGSSNVQNCYIDIRMKNEVQGHMHFMKPCEQCLSKIEASRRHAIDMTFDYSHHRASAGLPGGSGIIQPCTLLLNPDPNLSNSITSVIGWEGTFHVSAANFHVCFGAQAYFSNPVSYKVVDIVNSMDADLKFDVLPRLLIWPKIFRVDPTIHEDIALYLLPSEDERSKENYVHLMEQMNLNDFALRSHVGNVELLIYSCKQLSTHSESMAMYLWGVFRRVRKRCHKRSRSENTVMATLDVPPGSFRLSAAEDQRNSGTSGFQ